MILDTVPSRLLIHPLWPMIIYLFMAITTLHLEVPFLLKIHIESLMIALTILFSLIENTFIKTTWHEGIKANQLPIVAAFLFISIPLISSFANDDHLQILKNEEYLDLLKMIIFGSCLLICMKDEKDREIILNAAIFSYFVFGLYFLYRFYILHEVRDFDQRPLLKIRHGDANFLCTFFSMMIPLPLLQAFKANKEKKTIKTLAFLLASALFIFCAYLTESRMGIISIFAGVIYLLSSPVLKFNKFALLILVFIFITGLLTSNSEKIKDRFININDKSNADRYLTLKNGLTVFYDNPIVGSGVNKARDFFYKNTSYPDFQSEFKQLDVHNAFLKVAAELGLVGFSFFMMFFMWPLKEALQSTHDDKYFLLASMGILTLSIMTIGLAYKDLLFLHLFMCGSLAMSSPLQSKSIRSQTSKA